MADSSEQMRNFSRARRPSPRSTGSPCTTRPTSLQLGHSAVNSSAAMCATWCPGALHLCPATPSNDRPKGKAEYPDSPPREVHFDPPGSGSCKPNLWALGDTIRTQCRIFHWMHVLRRPAYPQQAGYLLRSLFRRESRSSRVEGRRPGHPPLTLQQMIGSVI